ncbi:MAG TPA: 50S ribosomal protein L19 [Flavobacteriales bacterium]
MMNRIKEIENKLNTIKDMPDFAAGDTIAVSYRIVEGSKERLQEFAGVVIQRRGSGSTATFTVRKISNGVGVERIFPVASPFIEKVTVIKRGKVRRARIFYLRKLTGKASRIQERKRVTAAATAE